VLTRLREGVELDDGRTAPAQARRLRPGRVELTVHEGRKQREAISVHGSLFYSNQTSAARIA